MICEHLSNALTSAVRLQLKCIYESLLGCINQMHCQLCLHQKRFKLLRTGNIIISFCILLEQPLAFRFKDSADPYGQLDRNMSKVNPKDRQVGQRLRQLRHNCDAIRGGTYAGKIALIPDYSIRVILGMVKASGLEEWHPDILGAPDSFYNQLHKQAFMKSFESTVLNGGYR